MCSANRHVRFTPESRHVQRTSDVRSYPESGHCKEVCATLGSGYLNALADPPSVCRRRIIETAAGESVGRGAQGPIADARLSGAYCTLEIEATFPGVGLKADIGCSPWGANCTHALPARRIVER